MLLCIQLVICLLRSILDEFLHSIYLLMMLVVMACSCVMLCSSACHAHLVNVSFWLCSMIMLHFHAYVDSCSCIVVASCYFIMTKLIAFKFNRIIMNLNNCWLSHGATELTLPVQPHLRFMGRS
mgnify:CR=1 FL=1